MENDERIRTAEQWVGTDSVYEDRGVRGGRRPAPRQGGSGAASGSTPPAVCAPSTDPAYEGFKQTPHSPGCLLNEQGRQEYYVPSGSPMFRYADRLGRVYQDNRGSMHLAFVCNDPNCVSEVWVRLDNIGDWIAENIAEQPRA